MLQIERLNLLIGNRTFKPSVATEDAHRNIAHKIKKLLQIQQL
jgi:hypothetical protein